jgi:hypothetical protein
MSTVERTSPNGGHGALTATAVNPLVGVATRGQAGGAGRLGAAVYAKIPVAAHLTGGGGLIDYEPITVNQLVKFTVTGSYYAVADPQVSGNLNSPLFQPISGLVTFTPRLAKGQQIYVNNYLVSPAYNAKQTVSLLGLPTGGTWTLSFGGYETWALAWNATPTQVQAALIALPSIGPANCVVVADVEPFTYDVEFTGDLGLQPIPAMSGDADLLDNAQGAGFCEITVIATALGSPEIIADTAVSIPTLTARIWNGVLSTIDVADTPNFQLVANTPALGLSTLIYDVTFDSVTFNGGPQTIAPFAFVAPTYDEQISLTDPDLTRLDYQSPSDTTWVPGTVSGSPVSLTAPSSWRARAAGNARLRAC